MMHELNSVDSIDSIAVAKYKIELWLLDCESLELYRGDQLLASLGSDNLTFTVEFGKLIFSCWTEERAESWRIIAYQIEEGNLLIKVAAAFKKEPFDLLLKVPGEGSFQNIGGKCRRDYLSSLCALIEHNFSPIKIEYYAIGRSDSHGYAKAIARLILRSGENLIAAVGVGPRENSVTVARLLGQGLNWFEVLRTRFGLAAVNRLMIFAPLDRSGLLAERLTLVRLPDAEIELFEVNEKNAAIEPIRPFDQGDLGLRLACSTKLPRALLNPLPDLAQLEWIRSLAPELIEIRQGAKRNRLKIEINGLEFARFCCGRQPSLEFGIGDRLELKEENRAELVELIQTIIRYRCQGSPDRQHPLFRISSESWLESILRRDIKALDPNLLQKYLYTQVPAIRQSSDRFIDLLTVRSDGRLVVIELKVSEEAELPFQGLDYWLRVEWHRARGDFQRRGYFQDLRLKEEPSLVYLVCPRLRFHKNFTAIAGSIDSRVPIYRIAINDNWREGLKVFSRERMN
jgi:hypothetical protein